MPVCKQRMTGARQLQWLKIDGLEFDNAKLIICALKLDSSAFSVVKLDHSTLRTCAQELDNSG